MSATYPRYVSVEVTREDARNGRRGKCEECPIALALQRAFPHVHVSVFVHVAYVGEMRYQLTHDATTRLVNYDQRHDPNAFPAIVRLYNPKKRIMG